METVEAVDLQSRVGIRQEVNALAMAANMARASASERVVPPEAAVEANLGDTSETKGRPIGGRRGAYAKYEVKEDTGEIVVKIIDGETGKVIRTIPPEELARLMRDEGEYGRQWRVYV